MNENNIYHTPVLLKESVDGMQISPNDICIDVTFGGGGHSRAILEAAYPHPLPKGKGE